MSNEIEEMLSDCEDIVGVDRAHGGPGFDKWDEEFLASIRDQFDERGFLTEKQLAKLRSLWDRI